MIGRLGYGAAWGLCAGGLLVMGFLASVYGAYALGRNPAEPAATVELRMALGTYGQVVLWKGLLPALVLTLASWPLLRRGFDLERRGGRATALAIGAAAAVAGLAVCVLLLPRFAWGLPPVRFTGSANFVRTWLELSAGVALAVWLPRWLLPRSRPGALGLAALAAVGALVWLLHAHRAPDAPPASPPDAPRAAIARPGPPPAPLRRAPIPVPADRGGAPAPALPQSPLPVLLIRTQVESPPSGSLAVLLHAETLTLQSAYEGDRIRQLPQARIERIERDHVLLDHDGRLERLPVSGAGALFLEAAGAREQARVTPEQSAHARESAIRLEQRLADERAGEPGEPVVRARSGLLAAADALPVHRDGELLGFRLENVAPDGFYARLGLREGDLVQSINGSSLGDARAIQWLRESGRIELAVERADGSQQSISVPAARLLEGLRALEGSP